MKAKKIKSITIIGKRWFDKQSITVAGKDLEQIITIIKEMKPEDYKGYQFEFTAVKYTPKELSK